MATTKRIRRPTQQELRDLGWALYRGYAPAALKLGDTRWVPANWDGLDAFGRVAIVALARVAWKLGARPPRKVRR